MATDLNEVLCDKEREILVRPFDSRWEAILTVYARPLEVIRERRREAAGGRFRGVGRTPEDAVRNVMAVYAGEAPPPGPAYRGL
jgi:hypothetical protein